MVQDLVAYIQQELPPLLNKNEGNKELFVVNELGLMASLSTVLTQEMQKFNTLLKIMKQSLQNLSKAIEGIIVMS